MAKGSTNGKPSRFTWHWKANRFFSAKAPEVSGKVGWGAGQCKVPSLIETSHRDLRKSDEYWLEPEQQDKRVMAKLRTEGQSGPSTTEI